MSYAERKTSAKNNMLIERSDANEMVVSVLQKPYVAHILNVDGVSMENYDASLSAFSTEPGKPQLPSEGTLIALPPFKEASLEIIESKFETMEGSNVAPTPAHTFTKEGEAIPEYHIDKEFYETHNQFYPSAVAELGEVIQLRDLRVVKLVYHPLQYNPVTKQLKKLVHLKLKISFTENGKKVQQAWKSVSESDQHFEPLYKNLVLNYHDAQAWRGRNADVMNLQSADSSANWFQTGRTYYRIPVGVDGVYRLTYNYLLSYGIDLAVTNNNSFALYYKGVSMPLTARTQDSLKQNWYIEFYAQRLYGSNSYFDRYTDTSMYWLTWNDPNPQRFTTASILSLPIDTLKWYVETSHQEKDTNYFFGVTLDDIENTDDVAGEGWYWRDFVSGQSRNLTFSVDTVQRQTGTTSTLRARLHGMTTCTGGACKAPSRHEAQFKLNGVLVGLIDWTDNTEAVFTASFLDTLIKKGTNTLQVISKSWTAADSNITKFYLDWFELQYPRPIQTVNGFLKFSRITSPVQQTHTYVVKGVSFDSAIVYDVTSGRKISNLASYGSQSFVFSDTVSSPKLYVITKTISVRTPVRLEAKTFQNLRVNQKGADYVVLTHSMFRSEADRLAQHRASTNKLRTAVIDVQDIYDEFNYGHLNPVSIRTFLKQAYYNWKRPSPAYVALFGDASWDFKRLISTSVKTNYVPSYGNPPSDNSFVSFDSVKNYIPYMLVGRIPVENLTEANQVVTKIIGYDNAPSGEWDKSFLFISGGNTVSEKSTFNYWSDDLSNRYVTTYPFGGFSYKAYKATDAIIDGENKPYMQSLVNNGLVFVNYIGHSGGRIWGVDIGSPYSLQNTNGRLTFVSSVSCNVGFFSDPHANVLAEDFLMADNRGAIATWAGSSIGYGSVGRFLVDKFLNVAIQNYSRSFGMLTTISRLYFWTVNSVTTPLVIQTMHLHPLIGDPYSQLAIPILPDFDISSSDIEIEHEPVTSDSTMTFNVNISNSGIMAGKDIPVSVQDSYVDERGMFKGISNVIPTFSIPDFIWQDSFLVSFSVQGKPGSHTIIVQVDPQDSIHEVTKINNVVQKTVYVYRNRITQIKPSPFSVIATQTPTFVVTVPATNDTTSLSYTFEIDTVSDFSSPAKITSPTVIPGQVAATWQAPTLSLNTTYYWKSYSTGALTEGIPVISSLDISSSVPSGDTILWRQTRAGQFQSNLLQSVSVDDSGVIMLRTDSTKLLARSLGYRAIPDIDYFSFVQINDVVAIGYWWAGAYSYLAAQFNPQNGSYKIKGFDFLQAGQVDSMIAFLNQAPTGNYVMLSVVRDAKTNSPDTLYRLIEQLGSTKIRLAQPGQSWLIISRKGDGTAIFEDYKPTGVALDSIMLGNIYSAGTGSILSSPIGPASQWIQASVNASIPNGNAVVAVNVLGLKNDGTVDTVMTFPGGTSSIDLSSINPQVYPRVQLSAQLSNIDGSTSPVLKQWQVKYIPTPDVAISAWSVHANPDTFRTVDSTTVTLDVHNIGYVRADSTRVTMFELEDTTQRVSFTIDTLAPGSVRHLIAHLTATGPGHRTLAARLEPKAGTNDIVLENNLVYIPIVVTLGASSNQTMKILFDDVEIHDGEYVAPKPTITIVHPLEQSISPRALHSLLVFVDGQQVNNIQTAQPGSNGKTSSPEFIAKASFNEPLSDGEHTLQVYQLGSGTQRELLRTIPFRVASTPQLLHVFNYPNPFSNKTAFTFIATGAQIPDEVHIKVYTVSGRMIRDIHILSSQLQLGFNSVVWDGRDQDGDEIANGVYFYRVSMKSGVKTSEVVERLTRVR